jgi:hypothetical protein
VEYNSSADNPVYSVTSPLNGVDIEEPFIMVIYIPNMASLASVLSANTAVVEIWLLEAGISTDFLHALHKQKMIPTRAKDTL